MYSSIYLLIYLFISLFGWNGTESTITEATYWPTVPALDDKLWWLWSDQWNESLADNWSTQETCSITALATTDPTHNLPWSGTQAAMVGSQWQIAGATTLCIFCVNLHWVMCIFRHYRNLELSLQVNMVFLVNIIRVLIIKLRAPHHQEPSQYR
jgi:hypothetical protein